MRSGKPKPTQTATHEWNDEASAWCVSLYSDEPDEYEWVRAEFVPTTPHGRLYLAAFCAHPRDFREQAANDIGGLLGWHADVKNAEAKAKRAAKAVNAELRGAARGEPPPSRERIALAARLATG